MPYYGTALLTAELGIRSIYRDKYSYVRRKKDQRFPTVQLYTRDHRELEPFHAPKRAFQALDFRVIGAADPPQHVIMCWDHCVSRVTVGHIYGGPQIFLRRYVRQSVALTTASFIDTSTCQARLPLLFSAHKFLT